MKFLIKNLKEKPIIEDILMRLNVLLEKMLKNISNI